MKQIFFSLFFVASMLCLSTIQAASGEQNSSGEQNTKEPQTPTQQKSVKEQTLSIIKPDAVSGNHVGEIISRFEKSGLHVIAIKSVWMTKEQAQTFYAIHKERPYFDALTEFMSSGPSIAIVLEGENAIAKNRQLMGVTDYRKAAPGTIRADFAQSIRKNCVHGSDCPNNANAEISFFFTKAEIFPR